MGLLRYITLTGAAERTDFAALQQLSDRYAFVEWAVLYSPARAGNGGRYPSLEWLESFAAKAAPAEMNIALHLCGESVKMLLDPQPDEPTLRLLRLAEQFGRVQLNVRAKAQDVERYRSLVRKLSCSPTNRTRVILQWNFHNEAVCLELGREDGFEALVDSSGGRGVVPGEWPVLLSGDVRRVGYAGGLGPHNLAEQLPAIAAVAGETFWVDMESRLRNEGDDFDLSACQAVLEIVSNYLVEDDRQRGAVYGEGVRAVQDLDGLWLDWWVGHVRGKQVNIPPIGAYRATTLCRHTGNIFGYQASENLATAMPALAAERIALVPLPDGNWQARAEASSALPMTAEEPHIAGLRALVAKYYRTSVPRNPASEL